MLSEDALIVLGALAALGAVVFSVLELLWPTRSRHPRRPVAVPGSPAPPPRPRLPVAAALRRRWRSSRPRHAMDGTRSPYRRRQPTEAATPEPRHAFAEAAVATAPPRLAPARVRSSTQAPARTPDERRQVDIATVVERCSALVEQRAYGEAAAAATAAIPPAAAAGRATEVARLWSIVALADQAMDDRGGARVALESAIRSAPDAERGAYERQLAALASQAAQLLVTQAEGARGPSSEEDIGLLREALEWLERGAVAASGDDALREQADEIQRRLWPAYERVVMALVQRQQYGAARRLLREALDDPRFPSARAETFRELFSGTYGGEIGQLTAQAIRSMHDARETEALGALERAEALLDGIRDEVLPPKRREEVDRRLWWGYKKLGRRRAQAGEYEAAAEALSHALRFAGADTARQADTRGALVRALEGLVEQRALAIRELAESGDHEAALVQSDQLWTRLRAAVADGLAEGDLAVAFAKAQRVFAEVGARR